MERVAYTACPSTSPAASRTGTACGSRCASANSTAAVPRSPPARPSAFPAGAGSIPGTRTPPAAAPRRRQDVEGGLAPPGRARNFVSSSPNSTSVASPSASSALHNPSDSPAMAGAVSTTHGHARPIRAHARAGPRTRAPAAGERVHAQEQRGQRHHPADGHGRRELKEQGEGDVPEQPRQQPRGHGRQADAHAKGEGAAPGPVSRLGRFGLGR